MTRSIRIRLLLAALLFITLGLTITGLGVSRLFNAYVTNRYLAEMEQVVDTLAGGIEPDTTEPTKLRTTREPVDDRYHLPGGGRYWQIDLSDGTQLQSRSLWDQSIDPGQAHPISDDILHTDGPAGTGIEFIQRDLEIETEQGTHPLTVYAGYDASEREAAAVDFRNGMFQTLLLTALVLMGAAGLQVWLGLLPLTGIKGAVERVRSGENDALDDDGPLEVRPLIQEINALVETQRGSVEKARQRASDLAHGVKTPLTVIAQMAELLDDRAASREILAQVDAIRRRTDRQLQQARLGVGQVRHSDLAGLTDDLIRVLSRLPRSADIEWHNEIADGILLQIDEADLAEALGNVLDNCRKWAKSTVRISATADGDHLVLSVDDDGPGIASDQRDDALARGLRTVREGSENGLGLAISAEIAEAYGGQVELGQSPEGGLRVKFSLPLTAAGRAAGEAGPA